MNKKNVILITTALILIIIIINIIFIPTKTTSIMGHYQSTEYLPDLYEYSFFQDGTFDVNLNGEIHRNLIYKRYKDNIFICKYNYKTEMLVIWDNKFYIYDTKKDRVVEMNKVSSVPSVIH